MIYHKQKKLTRKQIAINQEKNNFDIDEAWKK